MLRTILFSLSVAILTIGGAVALTPPSERDPATVKIDLPNSIGSGVHLGHGVVLTASHVVDGETEINVITKSGASTPAQVLWSAKEYDVALLQAPLESVEHSSLACHTIPVGAELKVVGHPFDDEWMTMYGRVAKEPHKVANWSSAMIVDITGGPGMSGGPSFDSMGRVAGIVVATAAKARYAVRAFMLVVPSSAICRLMGR